MLNDKIQKDELSLLYSLTGDITPLGNGLINQTYLAQRKTGEKIVLQRINTLIFQKPHHITQNIKLISKELKKSEIYNLGILIPVKNLKGEDGGFTKDKSYWRATEYSSELKSVGLIENTKQAEEGGYGFGLFSAALVHINPKNIHETIPDFLNLIRRFEAFKQAVKKDTALRAAECSAEISYLLSQEHICKAWLSYCAKLPVRITHNDTKINNLLFTQDDKAKMVIDLDTVMPGFLMHDFGDMVRTMIPTIDENSAELKSLMIREDIFTALAKGYLKALGFIITKDEVSSLLFGARAMILISALRFLTDYLEGDRYFKITSPKHNLVRCQNQICLNQKIVKDYKKLERILISCI